MSWGEAAVGPGKSWGRVQPLPSRGPQEGEEANRLHNYCCLPCGEESEWPHTPCHLRIPTLGEEVA